MGDHVVGQLANRITDPIMLVVTLAVFFSLWRFAPRLDPLLSACLASLVSAVAFATFITGTVPDEPIGEADASPG